LERKVPLKEEGGVRQRIRWKDLFDARRMKVANTEKKGLDEKRSRTQEGRGRAH